MLKLQNTVYDLGVHGEVGTSHRLWRLQPCCLSWKNLSEGSEEITVGRGSIQRLYRGRRSGTGRGHGQVWVCFWCAQSLSSSVLGSEQQLLLLCCLMSSDVGWHIRDKLRPMSKHGSVDQYSFTSTETRRLVRMDSPGRPPQLSHSSWTMRSSRRNLLVLCLQLYKAIVDFAEHPPRQFCCVSSLFKTCLHKIFEHGCISAWLSVRVVVGHVPGHLALNFFQ